MAQRISLQDLSSRPESDIDDDGVDYFSSSKDTEDKRKYLKPGIIFGEIMCTLAVIIGLFIAYQLYFTSFHAERAQQDSYKTLTNKWSEGKAPETITNKDVVPGDAVALIRLPYMKDKPFVIYKGVTQDVLRDGPGLYDESAPLGNDGNTSIAAHRDGWNAPFSDIDKLNTCDPVEIETQDKIYTYKVTSTADDIDTRSKQNHDCFDKYTADTLENEAYRDLDGQTIVPPTQVSVIDDIPLPDNDYKPMLSLLTLTTCHPHWSNETRLIVHAALTDIKDKK